MNRVLNISPEFLDAKGKAWLYRTNKIDWVELVVPNYGNFVAMSEERSMVYQINNVYNWIASKSCSFQKKEQLGLFAVRDFFPKMKLFINDYQPLPVEFWVNAIFPNSMPLDKTKIRYEIYTNEQQARQDAHDEVASRHDVLKVTTTKVSLNLYGGNDA